MKKFVILTGLLSLVWVIYALFQPIFDWNFGWEEIPGDVHTITFQGIENEQYLDAIQSSKLHLDSILKISSAPSISVSAMIDGKLIWSYAIGYQNIKKRIPADTSTQYRIGSVSKALTSLGLGKMMEKGLIHPDSSVQYYTGHFDNKPKITIRQLASHQSGIRNYSACFCFPVWEYYRNVEFESVEASLNQFEADDLLFIPGEYFSYSSYNFTALSSAMEKASGQDFLGYMSKSVFNQLGMSHTQADKTNDASSSKAIHYDAEDGFYKKAFEVNLSNKWAGGGFVSTPSDLVRAGNALLDSTFLDSLVIDQLITPQQLSNGTTNPQNYAMGWRHDFSERYFNGKAEVEIIHHGGMAVGGLALLVVYPEYDLVLAIAINKSGQNGRFELFDYINPIVELFIAQLKE